MSSKPVIRCTRWIIRTETTDTKTTVNHSRILHGTRNTLHKRNFHTDKSDAIRHTISAVLLTQSTVNASFIYIYTNKQTNTFLSRCANVKSKKKKLTTVGRP